MVMSILFARRCLKTVSIYLLMAMAHTVGRGAGFFGVRPSWMVRVRFVSGVFVKCCVLKPCYKKVSGIWAEFFFRTSISIF